METERVSNAWQRLYRLRAFLSARLGNRKPQAVVLDPSWRPVTLRAPLLGCLTAFPLVLMATFEYLSNESRRHGGIVFAQHDSTNLMTFTYFYLPTVLAVTYSMIWAWIALDTKRLEAYFQMSKAEGASPANSIFLHYPFDLELVPPIRAIQLRHWSVVIACFVSTIVFCGITPLSGAVFEYRIVTHSAATGVTHTASLLPVSKQSSSFNRGFMMNAYSTLWLDQKLPSFTTRDAAFIPFKWTTRWGQHFFRAIGLLGPQCSVQASTASLPWSVMTPTASHMTVGKDAWLKRLTLTERCQIAPACSRRFTGLFVLAATHPKRSWHSRSRTPNLLQIGSLCNYKIHMLGRPKNPRLPGPLTGRRRCFSVSRPILFSLSM